jgi:hypothetical protein
MRLSERQIMRITRKVALPAAAITTAAIAPGASAAAAATVPHHSDTATAKQAAAPRRARAIDILDHDPFGHDPLGVRPETASRNNNSHDTIISFRIIGKGDHVSTAGTDACTTSLAHWGAAHLEIQKPNGQVFKNGPTRDLFSSSCMPDLVVNPNINDAGRWHAILWNKVSTNDYFKVVSTYINVG